MVRIQGRNVSIFPALSAASSQAGAADAEIKSPPGGGCGVSGPPVPSTRRDEPPRRRWSPADKL
ncbi:hypothetical protein CKJ90_08720 [Klebsiella pneumoniae]|nr:hypothetical protein CKJ89_01020 [Klebsiella pneumoniae]PAW18959.1 hypothetical protein CKJ90_08720 [Klebsiella pneumoniae]